MAAARGAALAGMAQLLELARSRLPGRSTRRLPCAACWAACWAAAAAAAAAETRAPSAAEPSALSRASVGGRSASREQERSVALRVRELVRGRSSEAHVEASAAEGEATASLEKQRLRPHSCGA